ncbi:MAG: hypothetical protein QM668_08530 [Agriterribacter sp.]
MKKKYSLFIVIAFVSITQLNCGDTGGGLVFAISSTKIVKDVLKDIEVKANTLMNSAYIDANALKSQLANELNVSAQNLQILLDKQLDKTFDKLSLENKKLLNEAELFRLEVDKLSKEAFELKNTTVLDVKGVLGDVLPWAKSKFFIQNIDGIVQLYREAPNASTATYFDGPKKGQGLPLQTAALLSPYKISSDVANNYKFKIYGIGFGTNSDKSETRIKKLSINNTEIDSKMYSESKVAAYQSEIVVSKEIFAKFLKEDRLDTARIFIEREVKTKEGIIFKSWEVKNFSLDFIVTTIPRKIKNISIFYTTLNFDFSNDSSRVANLDFDSLPGTQVEPVNPIIIPYSFTTPNHHQDNKPIISYTYPVETSVNDNQKILSIKINNQPPVGTGCPWTSVLSSSILEDGKKMKVVFETHGQPCTYFYEATILSKVNIENDYTLSNTIEYGTVFTFSLPVTAKYWKIDGITPDNRRISIVNRGNFESLIKFEDETTLGSKKMVSYKVGLPF